MKVTLTRVDRVYRLNYIDDKLINHKRKSVAFLALSIDRINFSRIFEGKCKTCRGLYLYEDDKREISVSYDTVNLKEDNVKSWIISEKDVYTTETTVTFYQSCE
jgi:hypothetical protein